MLNTTGTVINNMCNAFLPLARRRLGVCGILRLNIFLKWLFSNFLLSPSTSFLISSSSTGSLVGTSPMRAHMIRRGVESAFTKKMQRFFELENDSNSKGFWA